MPFRCRVSLTLGPAWRFAAATRAEWGAGDEKRTGVLEVCLGQINAWPLESETWSIPYDGPICAVSAASRHRIWTRSHGARRRGRRCSRDPHSGCARGGAAFGTQAGPRGSPDPFALENGRLMIAPRTVLRTVSGAKRRFPVIIDDEQVKRSSGRAWQALHGVPVATCVSLMEVS